MSSKSLMVSNMLILTTSLLCTSLVLAEDDAFNKTKISSQHVSNTVYMLKGMGGNIGVSAGDDGILIIDDQFAPLAEKIAAAIGDIAKTPMKFVVNTHYHGDHTGSNAYFSEVQGSTIFAHDNVRQRLASKAEHTHAELPVVTYQQGITFHFNGDTIKVQHLPGGHTDSDSVVWFEKANVLHSGDLLFAGLFPFIDLDGGGTVDGYIKNVTTLVGMLKDDTKIIPGHGELSTKADYQKALNMMVETASFIKTKKSQGVSLDDLIEQGLDKKYQSWSWSFIPEKRWITTLFNGQ